MELQALSVTDKIIVPFLDKESYDDFHRDEERLVSASMDLFFPSTYEKRIGKGNPVYANTIGGTVPFYPLLSSRIIDFLEDQGPGSTDMCIPLKAVIDGTVYVYTSDGACGDSLVTCPESEWNKSEALRLIEDFHLEDWDEDDDEEWD